MEIVREKSGNFDVLCEWLPCHIKGNVCGWSELSVTPPPPTHTHTYSHLTLAAPHPMRCCPHPFVTRERGGGVVLTQGILGHSLAG